MPVQTGPPLQVAEQVLFEQLLPGGQAWPQPPQFCELLVVSTQPVEQHCCVPVQPGPPLQEVSLPQIPITQASLTGQSLPQVPQLAGSLATSVQMPLQLTSGAMQAMVLHASPPPARGKQQPPPMQTLAPAGQAAPHPPQLARSLLVSMQVVPQQVLPAAQPVVVQSTVVQTPATQDAPFAQALPQTPQLAGSLVTLTSHPSAIWPSQSAKPVLHEVIRQPLATQPEVPLATIAGQTLPQPPQLLGSSAVTAQVTPQHVWAEGHGEPAPQPPTQVPPEHESPAGQALLQPPQLAGSVSVFTSQPSVTTLSQSAKPGAHATMLHAELAQPARASGKGPQALPQPPQLPGSDVSSVQMGWQQESPFGHTSPLQRPTHWKLAHSSPLGHWELAVQTTQVWVSVRQCGVGLEQSASLVQPPGMGTHLCVLGSHVSPVGQLSGLVWHALVAPPVPL